MDSGVVVVVVAGLALIGFVSWLIFRSKTDINTVAPEPQSHPMWESKTTTTYREPSKPDFPPRMPVPPVDVAPKPRVTPVYRDDFRESVQRTASEQRPVTARPGSSPIRHEGQTYYPGRDGGYVNQQGSSVSPLLAGALGAVAGGLLVSAFSHSPAQAATAAPAPSPAPTYGDASPFAVPARENSVDAGSRWGQAPDLDQAPARPDVDLSDDRTSRGSDPWSASASSAEPDVDLSDSFGRTTGADSDLSTTRGSTDADVSRSSWEREADTDVSSGSSGGYASADETVEEPRYESASVDLSGSDE